MTKSKTTTTDETPAADDIERRVLKFAEQLGWLAGTVQAKSEGWLDRATLHGHVTRIRDSANELMTHLADGARKAAKRNKARTAAARRQASPPKPSRGAVDGPGKRHRPAPPSARGVKHSDQRIAKVVLARNITRRPRG